MSETSPKSVNRDGPKLLFLVSEDWFFCLHWLAIARGARDAGWRVVVVCRVNQHGDAIRSEGFDLIPLAMERGSASPVAALADLRAITRILRRERPDMVHNLAVKLSLIGTAAALIAGVPHVVNTISGLGYLFIANTAKARVLRVVTLTLLRRLLRFRRVHTTVQNADDRDWLIDSGLAPSERVTLIRGAGVDVSAFVPGSPAEGSPWVVFVGRMLIDKGVNELVEAARILQRSGHTARVILVGSTDPENPQSLDDGTLSAWNDEGVVEWWGHRTDVPSIWMQATIAVLPSYREGLPKSLLEAGACGLPLVATDVPGCRELVRDGIDGVLVPAQDADALAQAIAGLLDDPSRRAACGRAIRARIVESFSEDVVVAQSNALYAHLLGLKSKRD